MHHDMIMSRQPHSGLLQWLAGNGYAPHSGCFLGDTSWIVAYVSANWIIGLAYTLVALLIAQRMYRAAHIPKTIMGWALLGIFVTCAGGHFLEGITTVIWPGYRFETMWHWVTTIPAWLFLTNHKRFSLIVEGPHMITETREELAQKNSELTALYQRIKQLDEIKTQFFANVSHELRTPLALIIGPVERMLALDTLSSAQRHDLEVVARNARTVLKHVNDLLDIAKMEAEKMEMRYEEVDLAQLVRVTAANFDVVVAERSLIFEVEAPSSFTAQIDVDKMRRVLLNLFSNAIKFTPDAGTILCKLTFTDDRFRLQVQDNGPGIPPDMRDLIFERFRQVEGGSARRFGGTGLGLAIVKDFVSLHGGSVRVDEAPGGGALFTVEMPVFAPVGVQVSAPRSERDFEEIMTQTLDELRAREEAEIETQETGQSLVLVVEDNPEMSRFIRETLAPDYRTVAAHDGQEGYERALDLRPDLILTDMMMPRKSGDQMIYDLRLNAELDAIPIIVLTAKADDELRIRLLRHGAQDYLNKPFAAEELRARVHNMVTIKRARQVMQEELATTLLDLELLAGELTLRKRVLAERNEQLAQAFREAHHRIKNNLQAVSALLEMQLVEAGDFLPVAKVRESLRQVKAIALVHDMLSQDMPIGEVNAATVVTRMAELLVAGLPEEMGAKLLRIEAETLLLPAKAATSLALIVNELVSNAIKHSAALQILADLPEGAAIRVRMQRRAEQVVLTVEDPGPGFPPNFDPIRHAHIGMDLVVTLVASDLQGDVSFGNESVETGRTSQRGRVEIVFPERPASV